MMIRSNLRFDQCDSRDSCVLTALPVIRYNKSTSISENERQIDNTTNTTTTYDRSTTCGARIHGLILEIFRILIHLNKVARTSFCIICMLTMSYSKWMSDKFRTQVSLTSELVLFHKLV